MRIVVIALISAAWILVGCSPHSASIPSSTEGIVPATQSQGSPQSVQALASPQGTTSLLSPQGTIMRSPASADALVSNGGKMHSFAEAQNLVLKSDADYGRFIDASIVGSARQIAIKYLKIMPPHWRGDFVYIASNGTVTSNRADLPAYVKYDPTLTRTKSANVLAAAHARGSAATSATPLSTVSSSSGALSGARPMEYPPATDDGSGIFIRDYSAQGINAAWGIATPPCDAYLYGSNDTGNMYFSGWSGSSGVLGSQTDAGIGAHEYVTHDSNPTDVFAYVSSAGWDPGQESGGFVNAYESWSCGTPLLILYGTLSPPNQTTSVLVVGPPPYDPNKFNLPPAMTTLNNPAWTFFNTPSTLLQNPGTYQNMPTNCMFCSITRMFSIAEPHGIDGSCYGYCLQNYGSAYWNEVVAGEITACGPTSFGTNDPCGIQWASPNWYAGSYLSQDGIGSYYYDTPNNNDQQVAEGLEDSLYPNQWGTIDTTQSNSRLQPSGLPTAPPVCTLDSNGYCSEAATYTLLKTCIIGYIGGKPIAGHDYTQSYYVFNKGADFLNLLETATETVKICTTPYGTTWSPNEPKTYYGDSNLP